MRKETLYTLLLLFTLCSTQILCPEADARITRNSIAAFNADDDSVVIIGPDVEEEEEEGDDDTPSSIPSPTHRDTLHTYTLNGMYIREKAKSQSSRTLYNIIIKNGRKVLKK